MAEFIAIECKQCDEKETFDVDQFVTMVKESENTRINLTDSGSLNLSWWICGHCLTDDE